MTYDPFRDREKQATLEALLADPRVSKSEKKRALTERYLGALMQIVGIRNSKGVLVGYREGFTKGKLEVLARDYAKKALKDLRPSAMTRALRQGLEENPALGRAFIAGWPKEEKDDA